MAGRFFCFHVYPVCEVWWAQLVQQTRREGIDLLQWCSWMLSTMILLCWNYFKFTCVPCAGCIVYVCMHMYMFVCLHVCICQGWESSGFCQNFSFSIVPGSFSRFVKILGENFVWVYLHYNCELHTPCAPATMAIISCHLILIQFVLNWFGGKAFEKWPGVARICAFRGGLQMRLWWAKIGQSVCRYRRLGTNRVGFGTDTARYDTDTSVTVLIQSDMVQIHQLQYWYGQLPYRYGQLWNWYTVSYGTDMSVAVHLARRGFQDCVVYCLLPPMLMYFAELQPELFSVYCLIHWTTSGTLLICHCLQCKP